MITEQEAREAAARRREGGYVTDDDAVEDEALLIEWSMQELARREAEQSERAKPIDAEWLLSIGFRDCGSWLAFDVGMSHLWWAPLRRAFGMNGRHVDGISARGQLLDIINGLKGSEL